MRALIRKIFEKASFHGFAYMARSDIHLLERIFWGIILFAATYFSIDICWQQWERYKENPIVFGVERIMGTQEFPYVGVTMCANYFDEKMAENIVRSNWNVTRDDDGYEYYAQFLHDLLDLKYDNLETLEPYKNDASIDKLNLLKTLLDLNANLYGNQTLSSGKKKVLGGQIEYQSRSALIDESKDPGPQTEFNCVITEVGMCVTSSFLHEYQNPLGFQREPNQGQVAELCSPFSVCSMKILPDADFGDNAVAYVHDIEDIVPQDNQEVIRREMKANEITNVEVNLGVFTATAEVRNVPIKYRKCRFPDENNLKYFKTYRPILCRNECRINAALRLCQCKPFFYVVGPGPICTIEGMLCLAKFNWKNTECNHCLILCSGLTHSALKATAHSYSETKFERSLLIAVYLPKLGIKRQVVFSIDQLVVAFGGATSLFLGCSFLSFAQILYYSIQYFAEKLKGWFIRFK